MRDSKILKAVGFGLIGAAFLGHGLRACHMVTTGRGSETYTGGKLVTWTWSGALLVSVLLLAVIVFGLSHKFFARGELPRKLRKIRYDLRKKLRNLRKVWSRVKAQYFQK